MVCPVCPAAGAVGGYVGGFFGIESPEETNLAVMGGLLSAGMTVITVIALKCLFGISVCDGNGDFSPRNIFQVGLITFVMGIIYAIIINYLISLWFTAPRPPIQEPPQVDIEPCCCRNEPIDTRNYV